MNLENIMLNKASQSQEVTYCMSSSTKISRISSFMHTEGRLVVFRAWRQDFLLMSMEFLFR